MRTQGWSGQIRAMAWVGMVSVAGMALLSAPARAQQIKRQREALAPKPVSELKPGRTDKLTPEQWQAVDAKRAQAAEQKRQHRPAVRVLSAREMRSLRGRGPNRNRYLLGVLPWQRSLRDVNLCTGNLFKSFTDIQVAPARGAGLVLQRTYNSNDERVGPFGVGWTHAYDIRMEEAQGADDTDYDLPSLSPDLNYCVRVDFFGHPHKYHRDADGLYSPPPYLFDETSSAYDVFLVNGPIQALSDTQTGMDGTIKHFTLIGNTRVCDYIKDRYGNQTSLTYTTVQIGGVDTGLLNTVTDPSGRQLIFTWTNLGTVPSPAYRITQVDGPQYSVIYGYDASFNLSSVTLDPGVGHLNRTTTFGYTTVSGESGLLNSITDPLGHQVTYGYALQAVTNTVWATSLVEPAGEDPVTHNARTQTWTLSTQAVQGGIGTTVLNSTDTTLRMDPVCDSRLRLTLLSLPTPDDSNFGPFTWTYDSANNATHQDIMHDHNISWTSFTIDNVYTYGPHGNVLTHTVTDYSGTDTTAWYNASQYFAKQSVTDRNGHTTTFIVGDNQGNDPTGGQAQNNGNKGSVLYVRDAGYSVPTSPSYQKQYAYTYNQYGQKTSETNLNGVVTTYTYGDQWGNLTQVVQDPGAGHLNRTTSMTYDVAGHVLTSTDPNSKQSVFTYNVLGQPNTAFFPATASTPAETISYTYGGNGRTESVSDNRGQTTIAYEAGSERVQSVTDPVTGTLSYTYAPAGERLSMTLPGGGTLTYGYGLWPMLPKDDPNALSVALTRITDDQGRRVDYDLYQSGLPYSIRYNQSFNGANLVSYCQTDYSYEMITVNKTKAYSRGLLSRIKNTWNNVNATPAQSVLVLNDYTFDNAGQRLTNAISDNTGLIRTESYGYDEVNRLKSVNYGDGQTQSYSFDAMGNRASKTDVGGGINGTESYGYNAANMLLSRGANSYTNDSNGNTLTGDGRTNTWDSENRLYRCVNGGTTSVYTYGADGLRRRAAITTGGTTTTTDFILDASMQVRERRNSANYATYLVGARGPEYRRDDVAGTVRWYLYDGLGSVLGEVDPNGNVTATRKYDVYGSVRSSTGTSTSKHKFVGGLGHPSDDETGLIYMRARYMDPVTGAFLSHDTSGNDLAYAYCFNAPTNKADSNGKNPYSIGVASAELWTAIWEAAEEGYTFAEILGLFGGDIYFALGEAGGVPDAVGIMRFVLEAVEWGNGIVVDAHGMLGHWIADEIGIDELGRLCINADLYDIETGESMALETGSLGGATL